MQEQIKHEFTLTDNQIGSLTLWFMVAYVCASPITGWLGDRFPRKPMIVVAALAIAAMNFLTAQRARLHVAEPAACGAGDRRGVLRDLRAGIARGFLSGDRKRNRVMTIFNIALPVGAASGYEAGAWVAAHHGWRMSFISSAVPGVLVALLILFFMREPQRTGAAREGEDGQGERAVAGEEPSLPDLDSRVCCGDVFAGRNLVVDAVVSASRGRLLD